MFYRIFFVLLFSLISIRSFALSDNLFFEVDGCINISFDSLKRNNLFLCIIGGELSNVGLLKRDKDYFDDILNAAEEVEHLESLGGDRIARKVIFSRKSYFLLTEEGYIIDGLELEPVLYYYKNYYLPMRNKGLIKSESYGKYRVEAEECILADFTSYSEVYICAHKGDVISGTIFKMNKDYVHSFLLNYGVLDTCKESDFKECMFSYTLDGVKKYYASTYDYIIVESDSVDFVRLFRDKLLKRH